MYSDEDPLAGGLPHSDIHGSTPARGSPWLFAACHVLHRLLVPRHPPNALLSLEIAPAGSEGNRPDPSRTGAIHTPSVKMIPPITGFELSTDHTGIAPHGRTSWNTHGLINRRYSTHASERRCRRPSGQPGVITPRLPVRL